MGRKPRGVNGNTPEQIKVLFNSEDKYKIGLRLYAVYQIALGKLSWKLLWASTILPADKSRRVFTKKAAE